MDRTPSVVGCPCLSDSRCARFAFADHNHRLMKSDHISAMTAHFGECFHRACYERAYPQIQDQ
jgi:hypothetical protein